MNDAGGEASNSKADGKNSGDQSQKPTRLKQHPNLENELNDSCKDADSTDRHLAPNRQLSANSQDGASEFR